MQKSIERDLFVVSFVLPSSVYIMLVRLREFSLKKFGSLEAIDLFSRADEGCAPCLKIHIKSTHALCGLRIIYKCRKKSNLLFVLHTVFSSLLLDLYIKITD